MRISDWSSDVCSSDLLVRSDVELRRRVAQLSVELVAKLKIMNFLVLEEIGGIAGQGVDKGCDRSIQISRAEAAALIEIDHVIGIDLILQTGGPGRCRQLLALRRGG